MKKQDCRVGMVVLDRHDGYKAVIVKCNPKNARVRMVDGDHSGELWSIPYALLDPLTSSELPTEMTMRSFEQPENEGIKTYFREKSKSDQPFDYPEGSPEFHIVKAICELWRRLDDDNLERECEAEIQKEACTNDQKRRPSTIMRDIQFKYSDMINKMFSALGREISRQAAERWESGNKDSRGLSVSRDENNPQGEAV